MRRLGLISRWRLIFIVLLGLGVAAWFGNQMGSVPPSTSQQALDWGTLNWPELLPSPKDVFLPDGVPHDKLSDTPIAEPAKKIAASPIAGSISTFASPSAVGLIYASDQMLAPDVLKQIQFVDVSRLIGQQEVKVSQDELARINAAIAATVKSTAVKIVLDSSARQKPDLPLFPFVSPALDLTATVQAKLSELAEEDQFSIRDGAR